MRGLDERRWITRSAGPAYIIIYAKKMAIISLSQGRPHSVSSSRMPASPRCENWYSIRCGINLPQSSTGLKLSGFDSDNLKND